MDFTVHSIGSIHSPYFSLSTPHQPIKDAPGDFWITVDPEYLEALNRLESYKYIYVLYLLDKVDTVEKKVTPAWAPELEVGLFASRSPNRPNPIGLSIVEIKEITGNEIVITGIDVYNGTPLLDIKPYVRALDRKEDANDGWYDDLEDKEHSISHMLGLSHEHTEDVGHDHNHPHGEHSHKHPHGHYHGHLPINRHTSRVRHPEND
ncbi:MAG: tRNA (N6-threonylcarbamoyladenosine(37)-N6)-methyltransferase TrmO [Desulfitobacteriaceae bacterium]